MKWTEVTELEPIRLQGAYEREGRVVALISPGQILRLMKANPQLRDYLASHQAIASGNECRCEPGTRRYVQLDTKCCLRCGENLREELPT